jgi:hypothetical protein
MAVARSQEWTTQSATSWTSSCLPRHVTDGVVHGSLQRAGLCECRADRAHGAFARRDRVIAGRPALLQYQPQLRDGNALKEAAVHVPAHDQVTDQRPDIPLSARRGAIPLIGPDLPDELPGRAIPPQEYRSILLNRQNDAPLDGLEELIVALNDIGEILGRPALARLARIARAAE